MGLGDSDASRLVNQLAREKLALEQQAKELKEKLAQVKLTPHSLPSFVALLISFLLSLPLPEPLGARQQASPAVAHQHLLELAEEVIRLRALLMSGGKVSDVSETLRLERLSQLEEENTRLQRQVGVWLLWRPTRFSDPAHRLSPSIFPSRPLSFCRRCPC